MAQKRLQKSVKKPKKQAFASSLNAKLPKPEIQGRDFDKIPATLTLPSVESLQKADKASTELLKVGAEFHSLSAGYNARLRVLVVSIYAIALLLKKDEAAWISFTRHKHWEGAKKRLPQLKHQKDALRYALRFAVGLEGADSKKASKYHRALVTSFNEDIPPEEVLKKLEEAGGFEPLASVHAVSKSNAKAKRPAKPVRPLDVDPDVANPRKGPRSAADWVEDLKSDFADTPGKALTITIIAEDNKATERLLNANPSDRLKMTFDVENVHGRAVTVSNARVKPSNKKQKRSAS